MAEDPYSVLGLTKGASEQEVGRAFRRLAKQHHPDVNQGDAKAEERFKAITAAHDYLMAKDPVPGPGASLSEYDHAYAAELEQRLRERRGPPPPGFVAKLKGALKGILGKG